jgi:hypothetical protein
MANERIVSPGVFTRERDLSFLTQGISEIGGAFIGPTPKGPAFIPTIVRSQQEYVTQFGEADANHYMGLTAKNYLREAGVATIVRVLGTEGYDKDTTVPGLIWVSGSGTNNRKILAVLHPTSVGNTITSVTASGTPDSFSLDVVVQGTGDIAGVTGLSADEDSLAYVGDYLGYSPAITQGAYTYAIFPEAVTEVLDASNTTRAQAGFTVASQSQAPSRTAYLIPTASLAGFDTSANLTAITVSGSGANFSSSLLPESSSIVGANLKIVLDTTTFGTLTEVTSYPLTTAYRRSQLFVTASTSNTALNFTGVGFSNAVTPMIQSQPIAGQPVDLFQLWTIGDGNSANKEIKVSFLNIKPSDDPAVTPWGTFSMLVRRYNDVDNRPEVLEQYDNLSLDPDSPQYIARVIGNSAPFDDPNTDERYYQGDFPNRSAYIYVQMTDTVIPASALPFGFAPINSTVKATASDLVDPLYVTNRWSLNGTLAAYTTASIDKKLYYGWDFADNEGTNPSYLGPISDPESPTEVGSAFNLNDVGAEVPKTAAPFSASIDLEDADSLPYRKFTVPFQGGFDGLNPARDIKLGGDIVATNSQGFNLSNSTTDGSKAYKRALQAISNQDQWDFNLLVLPGVIYEYHSYISTEALNLCEERGDAFYLMDTVGLNSTIANATGKAAEIDSNYAATYYPWLRVIDTNTNKLLWVPPSVILPEIYAYNDNVAAEWFAPAGLNRGGIASAVGVRARLSQPSRDTLYEGKVNPIAQFPGQGICVWGQKTLQRRASALDRVNVRRLLIAVKKYIASVSRYLVFEQNVESTRNRFLNIVNPYLASVQERSGLYAFRVIMDETNNTPDLIDRNILYGQLYLQPTRTAEFIILDFNVLPTGAAFPTA